MTGRSLVPLLQGTRAAWRDAFLYEYNYEKQFPYTPNVRGVRTDRLEATSAIRTATARRIASRRNSTTCGRTRTN